MFRSSLFMLMALAGMMPMFAFGQTDEIRDNLVASQKQYDRARDQARQQVLDRFAEVMKELASKGQIDASIEVQKAQKLFVAEGVMVTSAAMKDSFVDYLRETRLARTIHQSAYEAAVKDYGKAVKIEQAAELKAEIERLFPANPAVSLQFGSRKNFCLLHANSHAVVDNVTDLTRMDATFEMTPGLANKEACSFRSVNYPNHYLAHGDFQLHLTPSNPSDDFRKNATFKKVPVTKSTVVFESLNYPDYFIRVRPDKTVWVDKRDGSKSFLNSATFIIAEPQLKF